MRNMQFNADFEYQHCISYSTEQNYGNTLIAVVGTDCVYYVVRSEFLNIIKVSKSPLNSYRGLLL
jgi:hypothetical protein